MTNAYSRPLKLSAVPEPDDDVPAAMWRPLFRTVPSLERVSPDARPMREQMTHYARLVERVPASFDESAFIVQAYQLCERTHGHPAIREALEWVTRLLSDAVVAMHMSVTDLAGGRGYPNAGAWAGALIEQHAAIRVGARRFPAFAYVLRGGSPNVEFEDVERGLGLARSVGVVTLDATNNGDSQPYIALAAAARQQRDPVLIEELRRCATVAGGLPDPVGAFIEEIARLSGARDMALPATWRWFVLARKRRQARSENGRRRNATI